MGFRQIVCFKLQAVQLDQTGIHCNSLLKWAREQIYNTQIIFKFYALYPHEKVSPVFAAKLVAKGFLLKRKERKALWFKLFEKIVSLLKKLILM